MTITLPTVGERFVVKHEVWRYPHFIVEEGATGTITCSDEELVALRLDEVHEGAEEWDNELHWYPNNCDDDPWEDIEMTDSQDPEKYKLHLGWGDWVLIWFALVCLGFILGGWLF
jgi:hypothetical protein